MLPIDINKLTEEEIKQLNELAGYLSFKETWIYRRFLECPARIILKATGNQFGKTASTARQYVARILGLHPVPWKNLLRKKWRFCSATLPNEPEAQNEVRNTQYPMFKKYLPANLIKKDITHRRPVMTIKDPLAGQTINGKVIGPEDITVEFVSYAQETQATAGVQRDSVWFDEEPGREFYEEQVPRLLEAGGDIVITCTPANVITWMHDDIYDRARWYVRTEAVAEQLGIRKVSHPGYGDFQKTDSPFNIAVFQAATDDNPVLEPEIIEDLFSAIDDHDVLLIRRYGIFKQISGRIYKDFRPQVHVIDGERWFG